MNWAELIGGLGIGSLLTSIVTNFMSRRAVTSDRWYQEKRDAYIGLLGAIHDAAVSPSDEKSKAYALWQMRCDIFGSRDVSKYAQKFAETNDGPRSAREEVFLFAHKIHARRFKKVATTAEPVSYRLVFLQFLRTVISMTEPASIYSTRLIVFDRNISDTQNIILSQGKYALIAMCDKIFQLYEYLRAYTQLMDTYIHPDIPQTLSEICLHQGIASSILFNDSEKTSKENTHTYNLRMERFKYVKNFCAAQNVTVNILSDKAVRNRLVHIDEYLAKQLSKPNTGWFIDSAVAFRDQFAAQNGAELQFCRSFIASEEIILHFDKEISTRKLWEEACAVLAVVFGEQQNKQLLAPSHSRQSLPPLQDQK